MNSYTHKLSILHDFLTKNQGIILKNGRDIVPTVEQSDGKRDAAPPRATQPSPTGQGGPAQFHIGLATLLRGLAYSIFCRKMLLYVWHANSVIRRL